MNVRTNSSAVTSSTSESATCETTNPRLTASPRRPAVLPRPLPFSAYPGSDRAACSAGAVPHSKHVSTPSIVVNSRKRQSAESGRKIGLSSLLMNPTINLLSTCASAAPAAAPTVASSKLSTSICWINRPRDAPSVMRNAISRSLALARASMRFARFAHAISSTNPEIPSNTKSGAV